MPKNPNQEKTTQTEPSRKSWSLRRIKKTNFSRTQLIVFVVVFGAVGYVLVKSFAASNLVTSIEAEQMALPSGGSVITDSQASSGRAIKLANNGTVTGTVNFPSPVTSLSILAKGAQCSGVPVMNVALDGTNLMTSKPVSSTSWNSYSATLANAMAAGSHRLSVAFTNDYTYYVNGFGGRYGHQSHISCSRDLYLDITNFYGQVSAPTPAPTVSLSVSPSSATAGQSSTLTWNSTNASTCTASGAWSGSQPTAGSASTGALNQNSTYTLACSGSGGTSSASATVTVTALTPPPSGAWQATLDNPVPPGSFWTKTISQLGSSPDPNSAAVVSYWLSQWQSGDTGTLALTKWGVAETMTTGNDPTYSIQNTCQYSCNLNQFGNVPIPVNTKASPDGDQHLVILDKSGKSWDMWHANWNGSTWTAGCGDALNLSTDYTVPAGVCGSNNGNLPNVVTAIRPQEIKNGVINHPLAFAGPGASAKLPNRCPTVSGTGGGSSTSPNALVNGMLFRLNPAYNIETSSLSPWEKTIARALQNYGMYMQDNSPNFQISTVVPINQAPAASWSSLVGWNGDYQYFSSSFPWSQMQLMTASCR